MKILWLSSLLFLTSCLVGPNYRPPQHCIPDTWQCQLCDDDSTLVCWWEQLQDPLLTRYIEATAAHNNTLLAREMTIMQMRALRQIIASQLFPHLGLGLTASRTYFSKNGPIFAIGDAETDVNPALPFELQIPQMQNIFTALLNASWTIDLFGKVRREVEAIDGLIGTAIAHRDDLLLTLFAEVAQNYVALRAAQQQGLLLEESIGLLEKEAELAYSRFKEGLTDILTIERMEAQLADLKSSLPPICSQIYQSIYALSLLTGVLPETLVPELLPIASLPSAPCVIACGLRSDLLRRRPDVRRAERMLAAATANIGVAVASFFPSLSLNANLGLQSLHLHNLFEAASKTWMLGGGLQMPLFQGGRLIGNLKLSEALAISAGYDYQQAVLTALQEAESALVGYQKELEKECFLRRAVEKYQVYVTSIEDRFKKGLIGATDLIEGQRQLNTAQQNYLGSEKAVLDKVITLYQALGGGWEVF